MKNKFSKVVTIFEISLLISLSFSFAFILSENFVDAQPVGGFSEAGAVFDSFGNYVPFVDGPPADLAGPYPQFPFSPSYGVQPSATPLAETAGLTSVPGYTASINGANYVGTYTVSNGIPTVTLSNGALAQWENGAWALKSGTLPTNTAPATGSGASGGIGGLFGGSAFGTTGIGGAMSAITSGLIWGAIVGGGAYLLAGLFGLDDDQAASVGFAAGGGTFAGTTTYFLMQHAGGTTASYAGLAGLGVGIGVGAAILLATYKEKKKEIVKFECLPYEPPLGGNSCEECNKDPTKPCSEYRCKSLGQACEIVNKGSEQELCVWVGKGDVLAPVITPWVEALTSGLRYIPDNAVSPPNHGVKIISGEPPRGCLEPWTKFEFGITTNEPAQCKIDTEPRENYDEMLFPFGESQLFKQEHTQLIPVVSQQNASGGPSVGEGGNYNLYVRCIDANGNGKDGAFYSFSFCAKQGPDTRAPEVVGFSIPDGSAVGFDADNVPIEVYTNEPAECKWSKNDKAFDAMENTMSCSTQIYEVNAELNYVCSGELTGIKNKENNDFYFRCRDFSTAPGGKNTMPAGKKLTLRGTEQLTVKSVGPSGLFEGATSFVSVTLEVETANGADEGKATCKFDTSATSEFNIPMDNTNDVKHNQTVSLGAGNYTYYFRCVDSGGNSIDANTTFSVKIDKEQPLVARVYKDGNNLKIITNEEAQCAYSLTSCDYEIAEATETTFLYEDPTNRIWHYTGWQGQATYYIKCADLRGREPAPDQCSIIVRGSDL